MNKTLIIIGLIIIVGGTGFSLLPHDAHATLLSILPLQQTNHHANHTTHIGYGLLTALMGTAIIFAGWKIMD